MHNHTLQLHLFQEQPEPFDASSDCIFSEPPGELILITKGSLAFYESINTTFYG